MSSAVRQVHLQGLAILLVVFVAGALAGAATERWRVRPQPAQPSPISPVPTQDVIASMKMASTGVPLVYEMLGLTQPQRDRIRGIMNATRPRTDSLLGATWPQLRALLDTVQHQVEEVLTPEQRTQLRAMRAGTSPGSRFTSPIPGRNR